MIKMVNVKTKRKDDYINNNRKINLILNTTVFFFIGLIFICLIVRPKETSNKTCYINKETENVTCSVIHTQRNFVNVSQYFKETTTEEVTKEQETTTEEVFLFKPYERWLDYDRQTGEAFEINEKPLSDDLQNYIWTLCQENNISYAFIMAQIGAESDFKDDTCSEANAIGLMQIRESSHRELMDELGVNNLYNEYENILVGITLIRRLFEQYTEPNLALMAYNGGSSRAKQLWRDGIYSTSYTTEILTVARKYEDMYGY